MATLVRPNSELFTQPINGAIPSDLLSLLTGIGDCAHKIDKEVVGQCVDERMNRFANELLEWSSSIKPVSTSVIICDQNQYNPQFISQNTYKILLERAKVEGRDQNYEVMIQRIKEAVVFGRMGNLEEGTIRRDVLGVLKLTPIIEKTKPPLSAQELPKENLQDVAITAEGHETIQEESIEGQRSTNNLSFSGGPFLSYEMNQRKSHLGIGAYGELLMPLKSESHWVMGAEIQVSAKGAYDHPVFFKGELKSIDGVSVLPLLEVGYRETNYTVLFQAGAWFIYSKVLNSTEKDPDYSDSPFENLQLRFGMKSYFLNHRIRVAGGYQHDPFGNGVYFEMGCRWGG